MCGPIQVPARRPCLILRKHQLNFQGIQGLHNQREQSRAEVDDEPWQRQIIHLLKLVSYWA
jgi:hypothetical protein